MAKPATKSGRKRSREQRRRDRENEQPRVVEARVVEVTDADDDSRAIRPVPPAAKPGPAVEVEPGVMGKLFGGGQRRQDPQTGLVEYQSPPGVLRPFARRSYQREMAMQSIRRGFKDLSGLMADIRDGLHDSVDRQGELLDQLKYLPVVADQNRRSAERFEEQFKRNNEQLARSNDLAGENLKVQSEALRQQADSVKALRDQILGQRDQNARLDTLLTGMGRESRDQKKDLDDLQGRMDRMRQSDQAIADNLGSVAGAIRRVSDQGAAQGELVARLQTAMDERTRRLEAEVERRGKGQGWLILLTLLLSFAALGAVAAAAVVYLRTQGALG